MISLDQVASLVTTNLLLFWWLKFHYQINYKKNCGITFSHSFCARNKKPKMCSGKSFSDRLDIGAKTMEWKFKWYYQDSS
jgi:hypothetical protein